MDEGGKDGTEANDSNGKGDVKRINDYCLGSVSALMLIEFQVIGLSPLWKGVYVFQISAVCQSGF